MSSASAAAVAGGYVVAYSSPSGTSVVHVDESGMPSPEHATVLRGGYAFTWTIAGDFMAYSDRNGAGVMRFDGTRRQLTATSYAIASVASNGHEFLFAWNGGGTIYGLLLDAGGATIGEPFMLTPWGTLAFSIASSGDGFLIVASVLGPAHAQYSVTATPVSPDGVTGTKVYIDSSDDIRFNRQPLVATADGYLVQWNAKIAAIDRNGNLRALTSLPLDGNEVVVATAPSDGGAVTMTDRGRLFTIDANAHVIASASTALANAVTLASSARTLLIVGHDSVSVVDKATMRATPQRPIATLPIPQSAPLIATADDGTILASWEVPYARRRIGRVRNNIVIDGDGIALDGSGAAIGTNGRDFLVATGGSSLAISFVPVTGPVATPRIIDVATDRADSIIWNGSNYIVFFTRWTTGPSATTSCGNWQEQIYAATISSDLRSATIQPIPLGPGSQKNAMAVKTLDGITLAYSPAHAISEAGGFTVICRDTTDLAFATLDAGLHVLSNTTLAAFGPRDDEMPNDITTDGSTTVVTWTHVIDPHNDGRRIVQHAVVRGSQVVTLDWPVAGAVWTGSRIVPVDASILPAGADSIASARATLAYIRPSLDLGLGDSQVMVVRSVGDAPPRLRPSR